MFIVGYFSYLFAEIVHFSGIISLFSCGLIMGHYTYLNISKESQKGTHLAFETIGYLAEAFVFVYLGYFFFFLLLYIIVKFSNIYIYICIF